MILQSLRMAFKAILSNKMRSFLTMLGVIIGVLAVVVLVSLVDGATASVTDQIQGLGSNLITVNIRSRHSPMSVGEVVSLNALDSIEGAVPLLSQTITTKAGIKTFDATVEGTLPAYESIRNMVVYEGRFLMTSDIENATAVAVIGVDVADALFGRRDVLYETLSMRGRSFLIVGILDEAGQSIMGSNDTRIIIPYTLAARMFAQSGVRTFYVSSHSAERVAQAENDVRERLLIKYKQDEGAFTILNQSAILDTMSSILGTMTLLLGGIAAISLLVGGIGIMNIMLVSVTERTREIGIRKAIGADRRSILTQFLIEALVISCVGGLIGLAVSWSLLALISAIAGISFTISGNIVFLSMGFSVGIGVLFGLYPASKASKLHPIQALRYDG